MYYKYNENKDEFISKSANDSENSIASSLDIPIENAKLFNGELYDNRDIAYWKLIKTRELETYCYLATKDGLLSQGVVVSLTEKSLNKLNQMKVLNDENNSTKDIGVEIYDINDNASTITRTQFKALIREVGNYATQIEKKYRDTNNLIKAATTIEQVQAIVI